MAVPGTGSTNQSLTFAAAKKLAGKAHTSNLREIYNETIPSNVQLDTSTLFGEAIPQTVSTSTLYARFSASVNYPATVEYVEFYIEDISGTTYNANTGSFGDVGFGGGDETQDPGAHGYQLRLTSSYQTLSSNALKGTGFFVNNQIIHESNGGLQLVNPSFGPQTGNNYGLQIYTGHPDNGGLQIPTTSPIEWSIDYFNGTIFVQDFLSSAKPRYARGFIYIGKNAKTLITEASSSSGGGTITALNNKVENRLTTIGATTTELDGEANLTFDGSTLQLTGAMSISNTINVQGVVSGTIANTSSFLALDSNNNFIKVDSEAIRTGKAGGGGSSTIINNSRTVVNSSITEGSMFGNIFNSAYAVTGNTGPISIQLRDASDITAGTARGFLIKDESGLAHINKITILASGSQTIDGASSIVLESPYAAVNIYSNGVDKYFIY